MGVAVKAGKKGSEKDPTPPLPKKKHKKTGEKVRENASSVVGHDATETAKQREKEAKRLGKTLRSRIVGHADVPLGHIHPHKMNYRKHGAAQVAALSGSLNDLGWVKSILVSKRTGTILDGHARYEEAIRRKERTVPVEYVDLSPEEENKALALLDPITEMATRDDAMFGELLKTLSSADEEMKDTLEKLTRQTELKDSPFDGGTLETSTKILEYTTEVFFPSTSKWGIPDLNPDMLYSGPVPTSTWPYDEKDKKDPQLYIFGEGGMDERVTGKIFAFYTDDWRFEKIWSESVDTIRTIVPLKPLAACQPDFSLWGTDPLAVQLYNLYRARWISRYWQEAGIPIIPSIAFSFFPECFEFVTHGLPKHIPVASVQFRSDGNSKQHVQARRDAVDHYLSHSKIDQIMVYSTEKTFDLTVPHLPKGPKYIRCIPFSDAWFINGQKMKAAKKAANMARLKGSEK